MKKTGQILKSAREKVGVSLVEVSMATKINPKVLGAIEEGIETALPARTFLRGFLRSYAVYLKLDPDKILQSYQAELGEAAENKPITKIEDTKDAGGSGAMPDMEARSNTMKAVAIAGIVILIVLILVVRNLVDKYEQERTLEPSPAVAAPVASAAVAASVAPLPSSLPAEEMPEIKPPPAPAPKPKPTPSPADPIKRPASIAVSAPPAAPSKEAPKPLAVTMSPAASPSTAAPAKPKKKAGENEIIIEALDKVSLTFQIAEGPKTTIELQPDQVHTIKAKGVIKLETSDGGAIDLIVNGRDTGVPGDLGKPKSLQLP